MLPGPPSTPLASEGAPPAIETAAVGGYHAHVDTKEPNVPQTRFVITNHLKLIFLAFLAETGTVGHALKHAGISYAQYKRALENDQDFQEAVEFHELLAREVVELVARERATRGTPVPQFDKAGRPIMIQATNPDGSPKMRPVLDPFTQEPETRPDGTPILETYETQAIIYKPSDAILSRILDADPKYSKTQNIQHTHQHKHEVGVMQLPAAPVSLEAWSAALESQPLPQVEVLPEGLPHNAHVITVDEDEDETTVEYFDEVLPGLPDFLE